MKTFIKADALSSLRPTSSWRTEDNVIVWMDDSTEMPTEAEIEAEVTRLQAEYDAQAYARSRTSEYPSINDYLDGIVKGDQAQIDAYIAACQAVKTKYPKPE